MIKNQINKIQKKYNEFKNDNLIVVKPSFGDVPTRPLQDINIINSFQK